MHREPALRSSDSASTLELEVARDASAHDCPDARQLRQALSSQSVTLPKEKLLLRVQFNRQQGLAVATIEASGAQRGTRVLRAAVGNCAALLEPVAVALAMLIDTRASDADGGRGGRRPGSSAQSAFTPSGGPSAQTGTAAPDPSENETRPALGIGLSAGPSLAIGLVPRATYGLAVEGQLHWQWASLQLQGAAYAADTVDLGGGQVRGQTRLGRLALCAQRKLGGRIHGGICGAGWIGQLSARTSGFTSNNSVAPVFAALGSVGAVSIRAHSHLDFFFEAAGLVPTAKHVFSVEGVAGDAFRTAPIAFTCGAGIGLKFL